MIDLQNRRNKKENMPMKVESMTPAFEQWFGDSKVVNDDGTPMVVYHGTWREFDGVEFNKNHNKANNIDQSLGFHFGTQRAANERIFPQLRRLEKGVRSAKKDGVQPAIMPVYLSLQNPLRLPDVGAWHQTSTVAQALLSAGIKLENQARFFDGKLDRRSGPEALVAAILDAGHDGIVYKNTKEHKGADSYIALNSEQIKSSIGNNGDFDVANPDIRFSMADVDEDAIENGMETPCP